MTAIALVFLALATIVVVSVGVTVVVARMLYLRLRLRLRLRRSRALSGAALRTRASVSRGPQREVLRLRIRLGDTLGSGQAAVDFALGSDGLRGELPGLFRRIQAEGAALDAQLLLLTSETDDVALAAELPVARRRVDEVAGLVHRLRATLASGRGNLTDDALLALRAEVDREITAVDAGIQALHTLNRHDHRDLPRGNET